MTGLRLFTGGSTQQSTRVGLMSRRRFRSGTMLHRRARRCACRCPLQAFSQGTRHPATVSQGQAVAGPSGAA